jgi:dCMP deaminase
MSSWDNRFMELAKTISTWSKDPSRKVGAVAIGDKGNVLAQGYNGFPRGVNDTDFRLKNRDLKLQLIVHAEMNVIYNATYNGVSLDGATLFVHGLPCCSDCAKGIIQVGIKRVVMPSPIGDSKWQKSWELSEMMFNEANIEVSYI